MEIVQVKPNELDEIIQNSGLAIQEGEEIKKSYIPFVESLAEIQAQAVKINFEKPTQIDEMIAGELRKKTVKIRTAALSLKDERKKTFLLKGNLEQAAYNLIAASCKLAEDTFVKVEKARELAEKKFKEERKAERIIILNEYEFNHQFLDLLNMPDDQFNMVVSRLESERQEKIEEEKRIEAERIEYDRLNKLNEERKEQLIPYWDFLTNEQKCLELSSLTESEFMAIRGEVQMAKAFREQENERLKQEEIRLKKELEEKEKQAKIERQKAEKKLAEERAEAEKKAAEERKKQAKIEEELKAKAEAERIERERLEAQLKAQELVTKQEQEAAENRRKAAEKAPDKDKLILWVNSVFPEDISLKTDEAKAVYDELTSKLLAYKVWAVKLIETL